MKTERYSINEERTQSRRQTGSFSNVNPPEHKGRNVTVYSVIATESYSLSWKNEMTLLLLHGNSSDLQLGSKMTIIIIIIISESPGTLRGQEVCNQVTLVTSDKIIYLYLSIYLFWTALTSKVLLGSEDWTRNPPITRWPPLPREPQSPNVRSAMELL